MEYRLEHTVLLELLHDSQGRGIDYSVLVLIAKVVLNRVRFDSGSHFWGNCHLVLFYMLIQSPRQVIAWG